MKSSASFMFAVLLVACVSFAAEDAARTEMPVATDRGLQMNMVVPGDAWVVATYNSPVARPAGLGWDGTSLWMVSDNDQTIYQLDPVTMAVLDSMSTPAADWSFGLDHDGTNIWGDLDAPELIYQLNGATGVLMNSFASPYVSPNGVAFDGSQVWHSSFGDDLALMNPATGTVSRTIPAPGNQYPRGLEWVGGALWVVDANGGVVDTIYRVDPSDGAVLGTYVPVGVSSGLLYGFAFDGRYFWLSDLLTAKIHKLVIDDGAIFCDGFQSVDTSAWSTTTP